MFEGAEGASWCNSAYHVDDMKVIVVFAMLALCSGTMTSKDRTITQVVKLLQGMLEKSKKEGDEERKIYAKFKCYCDTSEAEETASIKKETENIGLLESKIEELQGDTGGLSSECADLTSVGGSMLSRV